MPTVGEPEDSENQPLQISSGTVRDPLLDALPVPVFVTIDHRFVFVNEAQSRILGVSTPADLIGVGLDRFLSAEIRDGFLRSLDEVASNIGSSRTLTEKWLRADGRTLTIEYVVKSISLEGKPAIEGVLRKILVAQPTAQAPPPPPRVDEAAVLAATAAERTAGEERLREALANARRRSQLAVEEAIANERQTAESRIADAVSREREEAQEAVAKAIAKERAAAKHSVKEAVAAERAATESALRDSSRAAAERASGEERTKEALANERRRAQQALEEAIESEKQAAESRLAEAVAKEREDAQEALTKAVAKERAAAKQAVKEAVAVERAATESAVRDAGRVATERAARESVKEQRLEAEQALAEAIAKERASAEQALQKAIEEEKAKFESAAAAERAKFEAALETERAKLQSAMKQIPERGQPAAPAPRNAEVELLLDSMAEGVYALDMEGRFTHLNRAAAEMLGHDRAKLIGKSAHATIHYKRRDGRPYPLGECQLHSGIAYGHMSRGEDEIFWTRKGASFPVDYAYTPILRGQDLVGGVITFTDITERKLLVQEMAQVERMSSLGRFAAAATHEFDKILQGIRTAADVIRWHTSGDELEAAKAQLTRMVERGGHLIRQISRFSESKDVEAKPIEVVEWFQSFLQVARVSLKENIELNFRLPDEALYVKADPAQLNQVFMNLVLNARDAMPQGGTLTLSIDSCLSGTTYSFGVIETPDRFIHFVVEDSGVGIAPELRSRIFEPLFTTKGSGTAGMGLAICHQLVRQLGGSIFVESTVGAGTQFHIFLPMTEPELEAQAATQSPARDASSQPGPAPATSRRRVVVLGSDRLSEADLKAAGESGLDVDVVYGGDEAATAIARVNPDALLMEISWMEADGVEVYREIATRWPKLPIIISTSKIHEVKVKGGLPSLPNVRYLPYDVPTLLKWVEGSQ